MGNKVVTCDLVLPKKQKRLNKYLTPEQVQLVQRSWDLMKDDLTKLGVIVFLRFFEIEPEMKAFFPKIVRMNDDNQLEWDVDREMLQKHAVTVMEGLGAAVESLDESDFLNSVLISVGQTHFHRSVRPQMLKMIDVCPKYPEIRHKDQWTGLVLHKRLWPALSYGLQIVLQDAYNKQVAEAWKKIFDYVCIYMKYGIENPEIDPEHHSVLGKIS